MTVSEIVGPGSNPGLQADRLLLVPMRTKEEQRRYQCEWVKRRRRAWIMDNGPCALCGSWDELEVDHTVNLSKGIPTANIWSLSPTNPVRLRELAKCRVLCRPCHLEKTKTTDVLYRVRGTLHPHVKLTEDQVYEIRHRRADGETSQALATIFGVAKGTIDKIHYRQTWRHLPDQF